MDSGCTQSALGGSGPICLPTGSNLGESGGEVAGLPMQENHSDCARVTQYAMVLGSCDLVKSDSFVHAQPAHSTIQSDSSQKSVNLNVHAWLLEPQQSRNRTSLRQWQHQFSLLMEDHPDQSMRQSGPFYKVMPF